MPSIKAPLLIQYAENDERINALWPAYEAALKASGVQYEMYMYPGTQHGFHNNSTPRYHEAVGQARLGADDRLLQEAPRLKASCLLRASPPFSLLDLEASGR